MEDKAKIRVVYSNEANPQETIEEINSLKGKITHNFNNQAYVVKFPADTEFPSSESSSINQSPPKLDQSTELAIEAWKAKQTEKPK
jgi:hypothetical protein